jgi:spectinomycin phosphotransferase
VSEQHLLTCLRDEYTLSPAELEFLPRGHDYHAGLYRVVSAEGTAYLLKVNSRPLYEPAFRVPYYLQSQGITPVVAPIPTRRHALWTTLADWVVTLYPFIEGDTRLTGMTHAQWQMTGAIFQRIHQVQLPPAGFASMRTESFDPGTYARWVGTFESEHLHARATGGSAERALHASWLAHQAAIHKAMTYLARLAAPLQSRTVPYVICHADLHAANLLRDQAGHVFVIDWDEVMLAPKERDFIFIRELYAEAFWQGYAPGEIDWTVLTYFRWERVVQDLIEYAGQVCFRDDLSENSKADLARAFHQNLADGSNLRAAYAAAAHLPRDLNRT